MTRIAAAAVIFCGSLVAVSHDNPALSEGQGKHRTEAPRASRSVRRVPLTVAPPREVKDRTGLRSARHSRPRDGQRAHGITLTVTMYCYTGSRNAAGKWPTVGTAAANAYPLGTRLRVEGVGVVVVEDRSAPGATDVDLYGGSDSGCEARAVAWGRRSLLVEAA